MANKEALQARVNKLRELYKTRFKELENPRANPELRALRKKLKRAQRKLRFIKVLDQKKLKQPEAAG
jgi:hypothetical protein